MHLLSETALWKTESEFVSTDGTISPSAGETSICIEGDTIYNKSWVAMDGAKRENNYTIFVVSPCQYNFESLNPELGTQKGTFHLDRNTIFSKFIIEATKLNGFEIISRNGNTCLTRGALYDGDKLINTWKATMKKSG